VGQGVLPQGYPPLVDAMPEAQIAERLDMVKRVIQASVEHMPAHEDFIAAHCAARASVQKRG
jgi:tryptophan halogenase